MNHTTVFSQEINPSFMISNIHNWEQLKKKHPELMRLETAALYMDSKCAGHIELRRVIIDALANVVGQGAKKPYFQRESVADIVTSSVWKAFHQEVPVE